MTTNYLDRLNPNLVIVLHFLGKTLWILLACVFALVGFKLYAMGIPSVGDAELAGPGGLSASFKKAGPGLIVMIGALVCAVVGAVRSKVKLTEKSVTVEEAPTRMAIEDVKFIADVGTGAWRLRRTMVKPGTSQPLDEMRRLFRHVEFVWDALIRAGAEIQDHTDKSFDPGMSLKVLALQPKPGLERERVIETVMPTIYFKGKAIQMGEVIVGLPVKL